MLLALLVVGVTSAARGQEVEGCADDALLSTETAESPKTTGTDAFVVGSPVAGEPESGDAQPATFRWVDSRDEPFLTITPAEIPAPPRLLGRDHPFAVRSCERCWWLGASLSFAATSVADLVTTYDAMGRGAQERGLAGLSVLSGQSRGTVLAVNVAASIAFWGIAAWIRDQGGPPWLYDGLLFVFSLARGGAAIQNLHQP